MNCSKKERRMKKPSCNLLVLTAAMMLFAFGCAIADVN